MRWFERKAQNGSTQRVQFVDVSATRVPSWLPGNRPATQPNHPEPALRPPNLPSELVSAIRHELNDPERAPRLSRPPEARNSQRPWRDDHGRVHAEPFAGPAPSGLLNIETKVIVDPAATQAFEQAVALLEEERAQVLAQTASQLAELATTIARRVIAHELTLDPGLVCELVREGLETLASQDRICVRIGPGFAAATEEVVNRFSEAGRRCEVRIDPSLGPYGCVVETDLGRVDESIETRLSTLLHALKPDSDAPK